MAFLSFVLIGFSIETLEVEITQHTKGQSNCGSPGWLPDQTLLYTVTKIKGKKKEKKKKRYTSTGLPKGKQAERLKNRRGNWKGRLARLQDLLVRRSLNGQPVVAALGSW